mmetsp:Transcript_68061/g.121204  ORF Transcript_68061/g.121204 Transcript_68061/m.121204 type:complete len:243 (+) Transcript_68061:1110-1838(+)
MRGVYGFCNASALRAADPLLVLLIGDARGDLRLLAAPPAPPARLMRLSAALVMLRAGLVAFRAGLVARTTLFSLFCLALLIGPVLSCMTFARTCSLFVLPAFAQALSWLSFVDLGLVLGLEVGLGLGVGACCKPTAAILSLPFFRTLLLRFSCAPAEEASRNTSFLSLANKGNTLQSFSLFSCSLNRCRSSWLSFKCLLDLISETTAQQAAAWISSITFSLSVSFLGIPPLISFITFSLSAS